MWHQWLKALFITFLFGHLRLCLSLIQPFVASRLIYWNVAYKGMHMTTTQKIQCLWNVAVCLVSVVS